MRPAPHTRLQAGTPSFRAMDRDECEAVLRRHGVGRIAYSFDDRVCIEAIHYVHDDGSIYGRTTAGSKLNILAHHPWVVVEVDDVDASLDWRSVVMKGAFHTAPTGAPSSAMPEEPVSLRRSVYHVFVDELTGRITSTTSKC